MVRAFWRRVDHKEARKLVDARNGLVIAVCLVAMVTDGRWHRIPNWLTFPAIAAGFIVNTVGSGWEGFAHSVAGVGIAALLTVPLFAAGFIKAGDVKLVAVWGAVKGVASPLLQTFVLWAFLYGAVIGGIIAVMLLARKRAWGALGRQMRAAGTSLLGMLLPVPPQAAQAPNRWGDTTTDGLQMPFPYGIALCLGALLALACEWGRGQPFPLLNG